LIEQGDKMKKLKVLSVVTVFVLLAMSTFPAMAKGKDPIVRAETFEVVENYSVQEYLTLNPDASGAVTAASGCKGYTLGRNGYSAAGIKIWTYSWTINWCYNGSTITSVSKYRTIWANGTWSFRGDISDNQSGGVGKTSYSHYAQGDFCLFDVGVCVGHSYPWVNQTVYGNGTYTGSAGGN